MARTGLRLRDLPPGLQLKLRRTARGLKQREVGELVGASESAICRVERGGPGASPAVLGRIDQALRQLETERRAEGAA